jgi:phage tail sheath protein FI
VTPRIIIAPGYTSQLGAGDTANPVCAAIPTILERLRAVFIPEGPTSSREDWLDWKELLPANQRILHPLRQDAKVLGSDGTTIVTKPASPSVAAIYARRDFEAGGVPALTVANQQVYGIVGLTPLIGFSIISESQGQTDIEAGAGIFVRGETGVDGALADSGFIFWGDSTLSTDSSWMFSHVVRLRDYMEAMQVKAVRTFLGRERITDQVVVAILQTVEQQLRPLKADGFIIDYRVRFEPDRNTPAELRLGHVDITFQAEEPPVLRLVKIRSRRYQEALNTLVRSVSAQLDALALN